MDFMTAQRGNKTGRAPPVATTEAVSPSSSSILSIMPSIWAAFPYKIPLRIQSMVFANDFSWNFQTDKRKLGGIAAERIQGDLQSGENDAADIISVFVDDRHGSGSSHINDNNGAGIFL